MKKIEKMFEREDKGFAMIEIQKEKYRKIVMGKLKKGQSVIMCVKKEKQGLRDEDQRIYRRYRVLGFYPNFVLMDYVPDVNKGRIRESFTYFEVWEKARTMS